MSLVSEAIAGRYYDGDGRPVDVFGRTLPHKLAWFSHALAMADPEVLKSYVRVPPTRVEEDVEDETWIAKIRCHCGEDHLIELNQPRIAPCDRHFAYLGEPGATGLRSVFAMRLSSDSSRSVD